MVLDDESGHMMAPIFKPKEKKGVPRTTLAGMMQQNPEPEKIHVEQLVDFEDHPVQVDENGFQIVHS